MCKFIEIANAKSTGGSFYAVIGSIAISITVFISLPCAKSPRAYIMYIIIIIRLSRALNVEPDRLAEALCV
ncbi:hypothetical protein ACGYLE_19360, partial [Sulfitobacter sp. 1A15142]